MHYSPLIRGALLFQHIHGLLDVILSKLSLLPEYHEIQSGSSSGPCESEQRIYKLELSNGAYIYASIFHILLPLQMYFYNLMVVSILYIFADDQAFLPGRCVKIVVQPGNVQLGIMGVLHPLVLKAFNVTLPCSMFEFSLEPFLTWLSETRIYDE